MKIADTRIADLKRAFRVRPGYWFVPKLFGYGATPVTWQGWATTIACAAALFGAIRFLPATGEKIVVSAVVLIAFLTVVVQKTDGDWRWRWGLDR